MISNDGMNTLMKNNPLSRRVEGVLAFLRYPNYVQNSGLCP